MGNLLKKFIGKKNSKLAQGTRPGSPDGGGSRAITGIDPGDAGSNIGNQNRRPGRRSADTPLGPRSGRRL